MGTKSYLFTQGYQNLKKHGSKTFSTMLIICATMILFGIFLIVIQNVDRNVKIISEEQGLQAFISEDITEDEIEEIAGKINEVPNVKEVIYLDKSAAFNSAQETLKDYKYLLDGLETANPFPASFIVKFNKIDDSESVKQTITSIDGIYKVGYNEAIINAVKAVSKIGSLVFFGLGGFMIIVSIFIISNTIKLAVCSNMREIFIMRYIGATNKFITTPFVIEGMILGIASALMSWVIISLMYIAAYARLPKIGSTLGVFGFIPYSELWHIILGSLLGLGLLLGILGSSISIKKYLKA